MKKVKRADYYLAIIILLQILFLMLLTWKYGVQRLDGDDTAEMVLANLLSKEGGILSHNWFYSTELRVLNTQIVMSLLFRAFDNWLVVRTLGTGILVCILVMSYLFMCSRIPEGDQLKKWAPAILLPFSYVYQDIVLYGLYYIPHISIIFISLGLLLSKKERRTRIDVILLLLLAFGAGLGGVRIPAVGYAPMFLAVLVIYLGNHDKKTLMLSAAACAATGIGFLINTFILSRQYTYMSHDYVTLSGPNINLAKEVFKNTIQFFGGDRPGFSISGICACSGLLLFLSVTYLFATVIKNWTDISDQLRIVILTFLTSWFITAFTAVFTTNGWANRYVIMPCMGFIPVIAIGISLQKKEFRKYVKCIIVACLLICSIFQVYVFKSSDKLRYVRPAYKYILDSGMTFGYSTWEVGDVLTEITNGRIHMCKIQNFESLWRWNWLMEKDYMKYTQSGPVFLLLDKARFNSPENTTGYFYGSWTEEDLSWIEKSTVGFEDDYYIVWVFSSEDEFEMITGSQPHE